MYWHNAGFGIDENKHPEQVEHLGITPLEAMASGCITLCYNAGGSKELIADGETGFLFNNEEELFKKTISIVWNSQMQEYLRRNAKSYVSKHFKEAVFKEQVKKIII